ncbi:hypothetical protein SNE40_014752 [Patella caerulea]|uniref:2-phosphoxylose phosphatase 1 n=1 Tax=Patella caerulea TaxID=87958 RepID=A0AAN8JLQ1_PATCE
MYRVLFLRRRAVCIVSAIWILTMLFTYVFVTEESQRSEGKRFRQQVRFKAKTDSLPLAEDTFQDIPPHKDSQDPDYGIPVEVNNANKKFLEEFVIVPDTDELKLTSKKGNQEKNPRDSTFENSSDPLSLPRIAEYCNIPKLPHTGQEGEVASVYKLKSVYTVMRHGDRTTLYTFPRHRNPTISCRFKSNMVAHPKINAFAQTMDSFTGKQNTGSLFLNWALYPNRAVCDSSFLTPVGALQHIINGVHFNQKYVQNLKLFKEVFSPDQVKIKVTEYSRTYQSAMAFLYGFLPTFNLTELNVQLTRNIFFCSEKAVGSSCECPSIQHFKKLSNREVMSAKLNLTRQKHLRKEIAEVFELNVDQLPFNYAMFDILSSYACHGIKLPCNNKGKCITKDMLSGLTEYLDKSGAAYEKSPSFKKHNQLSSYPLLMDIGNHMISVAHGKTNEKFVLYSGHDKTVSPVLSVLGINPGKWVKYATRVVFELYNRHDVKDHYYIRILHDGKDLTSQVNFCKEKMSNGLCKIKHFLQFLKEDILNETRTKQFSKACKDFTR